MQLAVAKALLWIFSMRAAGCGRLLLSAWLDGILQRHRCRIKDWPSSQAANVCDFHSSLDVATCCVVRGDTAGGMRLGCRLSALSSRCRLLMRCAVGIVKSAVVDVFDASSGKWTTAALSVARGHLAAASLPNQGLVIFAGGSGL